MLATDAAFFVYIFFKMLLQYENKKFLKLYVSKYK